MIGVFSQFLKDINNLPDVQSDKTYIVPLLAAIDTPAVTTIKEAYNLVKGVTVSADHSEEYFQLNSA
jgi:hypothetical protein